MRGDKLIALRVGLWENRQLAQEWAYRFLGAAAAYADDEAIDL